MTCFRAHMPLGALAGRVLRYFGLLREVGLPVALGLPPAVARERERVAGFELADVAVGRQRRGHAHEGEVVVYGLAVYLAADRRVQEQRRELGAEDERVAHTRVEQGLFADAVAREEQLLPALVPDGEGEHAAQVLRTIRPVLLVGVDYRLRVAVGAELVAEVFESLLEFAVVVDFAVEDYPTR